LVFPSSVSDTTVPVIIPDITPWDAFVFASPPIDPDIIPSITSSILVELTTMAAAGIIGVSVDVDVDVDLEVDSR